MGLQLILGGSGTGKTTYLCKELIGKSKEADKPSNYLMIVPEQFTMEMQKNIVNLSKERGTMKIDILSFDRLAKRIFDEAGLKTFSVLDDTGKCLIIRKIIEEKKDELVMFGKKAGMMGFVEEVKSIISEIYQYGIGNEEFDKMLKLSESKPILNAKLRDIRIILAEIEKQLKEEFIINEELLHRVCELIPGSSFVKNCNIVFDEYTGFTPVQYKVIGYLLEYAEDVTVALTIRDADKIDFNKINPDSDVFGITIKTVNKLKKIAKDSKTEIYSDIILKKMGRFGEKKDIIFMENNLFKYGKGAYKEPVENISIHICNNTYDEAEFVAYTIKKMVQENEYRYKDIAVIASDIEEYYRPVSESFARHNIPGFIDHKKNIIANPMVENIRAALEVITENFSYDAVFRYLKAGLSSLSKDEVDKLENYVLKRGIKGHKKFAEAFEAEEIDVIREKFMWDMEEIYQTFKNGRKVTVKAALTEIYGFILKLNLEEKIKRLGEYFKNNNELSKVAEYSQTFAKIMEFFDEAVLLVGDERMTVRELSAVLDSGFENIKVGIIPPTLDRVVVGDTTRTRLNNIKIMFIMGANDELIPKSEASGGIFTRMERNFLYDNEIVLSPTAKENAFIQKYYLYRMFTKMSDRLFVSFKRIKGDGSSARPSYIIQSIMKMFPKIKVVEEDNREIRKEIDKITNIGSAKKYVAENIYDYIGENLPDYEKKLFREVYSFCINNDVDIDKYMEAVDFKVNPGRISEAVAKAVYGINLKNSVSRLEKFAACEYSHFLNYGLALQPRREFEIQSSDVGNIYHMTMENFFNKVTDRKIEWKKMDDELRDAIISESIDEVIKNSEAEKFMSTSRDKHMLDKISKISKRTAWILQEQIKAGKFKPSQFEIKFSSDYGLDELKYVYDDGAQMGIKGVIDRVDYYNDGDDIYVKIVDYKSGNKKIELNDIYNGLQLQLVLYMEAAMEFARRKNPDKNIIPAGMFYHNIDDPVVEEGDVAGELKDKTEDEIKNDVDNQVLSKSLPVGLFNSSEYVLKAFDENIDDIKERAGESLVIPVKYGKSGMKKNDNAITQNEMETLIKFVHNKVGELGKKILEGEIALNPYIIQSVQGNSNDRSVPCTYCEFNGVCGFDKKIKGCNYRKLNKEKKEEIWKKMREENISNGMDE